MQVTFSIGLARKGQEISFKGYRRQPLVLTFDSGSDYFLNRAPINFAPALSSWGLIDGFSLATTEAGPVVAVSPLIVPVFIKAGHAMFLDVGRVSMNRRSADAILNRNPILIGPRNRVA